VTTIVLVFGILIVLLGVYGMAQPVPFLRFVGRFRSPAWLNAAALIRVALGIVLLLAAPDCRFTLAVQILGVLVILAGVVLPMLKRSSVEGLMDWFIGLSLPTLRAWLVVAIFIGLFFFYVAV
jgi:hypothetical protein